MQEGYRSHFQEAERGQRAQHPFPQGQGQLLGQRARGQPRQRTRGLLPIPEAAQGRDGQSLLPEVQRVECRFFQDNLPIEDFKFWSGLAKKKFMGLNFVSMF